MTCFLRTRPQVAAGREALLVNIPLTFPPPDMKGRLVAGGVLGQRLSNLLALLGTNVDCRQPPRQGVQGVRVAGRLEAALAQVFRC